MKQLPTLSITKSGTKIYRIGGEVIRRSKSRKTYAFVVRYFWTTNDPGEQVFYSFHTRRDLAEKSASRAEGWRVGQCEADVLEVIPAQLKPLEPLAAESPRATAETTTVREYVYRWDGKIIKKSQTVFTHATVSALTEKGYRYHRASIGSVVVRFHTSEERARAFITEASKHSPGWYDRTIVSVDAV